MQITIDTDLIKLVQDKSGKLTIDPEACKLIAQFQEISKQVEEADKDIKDKIKNALNEANLSVVTGEGVKVSMYPYGTKYVLVPEEIDKVDKSWYEVKTTYKLDSDKVEDFVKKNDVLPMGIIEPERQMTLRITVKNGN